MKKPYPELLRDLDDFLKRDRDRELFDLPPLAKAAPASQLLPRRTWRHWDVQQSGCRHSGGGLRRGLPDGSWGARHSVPGKLPDDLEGATIEIKTRRGKYLIPHHRRGHRMERRFCLGPRLRETFLSVAGERARVPFRWDVRQTGASVKTESGNGEPDRGSEGATGGSGGIGPPGP